MKSIDFKFTRGGDAHWETVKEIGQRYEVGRLTARRVLTRMGLLDQEGREGRWRLTKAAERAGLGIRINKTGLGWPLDRISPEGQALIAEAWDRTLADIGTALESEDVREMREALEAFKAQTGRPMDNRTAVCWLVDHFEHELSPTNTDLGNVLGVSSAIVGRYISQRGLLIRQAYEDDRDGRDMWACQRQGVSMVHPSNLTDPDCALIECGSVVADIDWSPFRARQDTEDSQHECPSPNSGAPPPWLADEMAELAEICSNSTGDRRSLAA